MLADFILENMETILQQWEEFAESLDIDIAMDKDGLRDHAQAMLMSIVRQMQGSQSLAEQEEKSKGLAPAVAIENAAAQAHADARRAQGFNLVQLLAEFRALRASVLRLWAMHDLRRGQTALDELTRFNEAVDQELTVSIKQYSGELDRSRELFLGILGHDLRTPLGSIVMSAEYLLYDKDISANGAKAIGRIHRSAKQMGAMIEDLVEVTRVRLSGVLPLQLSDVDLASVCHHVVEQARAFHPERELTLEMSGNLMMCGDAERLTQVLSNLVGNAVKHGDPHRPVSVHGESSGEELVVLVHNEGNVMPASVLPHIFDPFYAVGSSVPAGGLGLGLYIARTMVQQHKGEIDVRSSQEEGTVFVVRLPRNFQAAAAER